MNASLIDELQLEAAGNAVSVSALLRKALMVAAKLDVSDLPKWIDKELSGYGPDDEVPPYRVVHGRVKGKIIKIMGRWIPVQFPDNNMESTVSEQTARGSEA